MRRVRPRFLPPVPGLSDFLELNLRTYVHDAAGVPGVWFYSLDANQPIAVSIARTLFHLPYEHAVMQAAHAPNGAITVHSKRRHHAGPHTGSAFTWTPSAPLRPAEVGTLEYFLAERYRLYAHTPHGLRRGAVHHAPYALSRATVTAWDDHLLALNGFASTGRPPDHVLCSPGVDVTIFPLHGLTVAGERESR